ncbi:MAG: DUF4956 domain-containing protein [Clostridia bacterium]|nr:DUF4956 domain-containing protein [Clostridia bacterium]
MSALFQSITTGSFTVGVYLVCVAAALVCGGIAAFAASFRSHVSKSFLVSLILMPVIVQTVITMVNGNIGTGVAVMGAFSLVRFRSVPGKAKDIVAIFLVMTSGLSCASGYVTVALLFTVIVAAVMILATYLPTKSEREVELKITIPETLNYTDAFRNVFAQYTKHSRMVGVKTTAMGSLFKLTYRVEMKDRRAEKEFIDALRCRNGNLEIAISEILSANEDL